MSMRAWRSVLVVWCVGVLVAAGGQPVQAGPGRAAVQAAAGQAEPPPPAGRFVSLASPQLVWDGSDVAARATVTRTLAGVGGIPTSGVTAVAATVAVGGATADGSLRAWAAGEPVPAVTTVYVFGGEPWASADAVIQLNGSGQASFFNNTAGAVRVTVVVHGYYTDAEDPNGMRLVPLAQTRILDTRSALGVGTTTPVAANGTITFPAAGQGGLPAAAQIGAVLLNITAVSPGANGSWRPFPPGSTATRYGHGHFVAGRHKAQTLVTKLSSDGRLSLTNVSSGTTHYMAEVAGYYAVPSSTAAASRTVPVPPQRLIDTTTGSAVPAGGTTAVSLGGRGGIPTEGLSTVAILLASRSATAGGYLTAFPGGATRPNPASDVQYPSAKSGFNLVWARVTGSGALQIYNGGSAPVHVWGDVVAYTLAPTVPNPPVGVTASAANGSATVRWQAPYHGGAAITRYNVLVSPGGRSVPVTSTQLTVAGLTNGTEYTFRVTATNAVGTSAASAPSNAVRPAVPAVPGQVLITAAIQRDGAARVLWTPPTTGADSATGYTVAAAPGGATVTVPGDVRDTILTGLTNGTSYTLTVTASNSVGAGPASEPSPPVTPEPATVPQPPVLVSVVPLDARVDLQWVPPVDGGAPVTGYRVSLEPGGHVVTTAANTTVAAVTGLTNGIAYTVRVTASNRAGEGQAEVREGVTPAAARAPGAPTDVIASPSAAGTMTITWKAPGDPGTSPVTGYEVTTEPATRTVTATGTSATVTGLAQETDYRFVVRARNGTGPGTPSEATPALKPALVVKKAPVVLSAASLAALRARRADGTLVFERPPAQVTGVRAGDIVAASLSPQTPNGLLRTVTATETRSGLFHVFTTDAQLTDVLERGGFSVLENIDSSEVETLTAQHPGARVSRPLLRGKPIDRAATTADGVTISPGPFVVTLPLMNLDRNKTGAVVEASVMVAPTIRANMELTPAGVKSTYDFRTVIGTSLTLKAGLLKDVPLFERNEIVKVPGPKWVIGSVGPVPIVVGTEATLGLRAKAEGIIGVEGTITFNERSDVHIEVLGNRVTQATSNHTGQGKTDEEKKVRLFGEGKLRVGPSAALALTFENTGKVGIENWLYVDNRASTSGDPWWSVGAGATHSAFIGLDKIAGGPRERRDLAEWGPISIVDSGGPHNGISVDPLHRRVDENQQVQLRVATHGTMQPNPQVHWKLVLASKPAELTDSGLFRSTQRNYAIVEATVNGCCAARGIVQVGIDPPGAPVNFEAFPMRTAALLRWQKPADNGAPIVGYTITAWGGDDFFSTEAPANATEAVIIGLSEGQAYNVSIRAHNSRGPSDAAESSVRPFGPYLDPYGSVPIATDINDNPDNTGYAGRLGVYISGNGRYAFFATSDRSNIAPEGTPGGVYLFRQDLITGQIVLASRRLNGTTPEGIAIIAAGDISLHNWSSSYDGNIVAFTTYAQVNDTPRARIYVHNIAARTTWDGTVDAAPTENARHPILSGSGDVLLYTTENATEFTGLVDLWRKERAGGLQQINRCVAPYTTCEVWQYTRFSMSSDGNRVVYQMDGTGDVDRPVPVLWQAGTWRNLMPNKPSSVEGEDPIISPDGSTVAIQYGENTTSQWITGLAVAPVSTTTINSGHLVVQNPDLSYRPTKLSNDGKVLLYQYSTSPGPWLSRAALRGSTGDDGTIASGRHLQPWMSDDARTVVWSQVCDKPELPCRPDVQVGPWARVLS